MKSLFVVLLLLCVLALTLVSAELLNSAKPYSETEIQNLWTIFTRKFEKRYGSLEASRRLRIFRENVETARKLNLAHASAAEADHQVYGLSRFMDLTTEEFKKTYLMSDRTAEQMRDHNIRLSSVPVLRDLPTSVDWRTKGAVTPVKNQGSCGSCWAFSATGNLEGQWFLAKGELLSLSEQQLVDCDHECDPQDAQACDAGCNGGLMLNAFQYVKKNGITTEAKYPYTAHDGQCKATNGTDAAVRITDSVTLPTDEVQIASYLAEHGPLAVALNAEWLQFYFGGISNPLFCSPKNLNHGVLMVGYGNEGGKDYWLVKNSWGSGWGEHGYFRMIRGKGKCGINTYVVSGLI